MRNQISQLRITHIEGGGDVCRNMSCQFQSLYFSDDGYVVRCKQCGHYQVAFMCIMFTVKEYDFRVFCNIVQQKCSETDMPLTDHSKCIIIRTPAEGVCFLLTKGEAKKFADILEQADNEAQALSMINLFNPEV